ncbi:MAG TPA: flagellar basal body P-ring formation chaperone FlgA [Bacteroidota bacterium]|nr:flagellar basal body P-ring formation chaperone FlgA [Bacteroidota bacterium]
MARLAVIACCAALAWPALPGANAGETALVRSAELRDAVEEYCRSLPHRGEIALEWRDVPDSIRVPAGALRLDVDAAACRALRGYVGFAVEVTVDGTVARRVIVPALLRTFDTVLVAVRQIPARAPVTPDDVRPERVETTQWIGRPVNGFGQLAGMRTKRIVAEGSALCEEFLEEVPLVEHGDHVTLRAVAGGVAVATGAVALEDGRAGSVITVRAAHARERLRARVTGPGQVQVLEE